MVKPPDVLGISLVRFQGSQLLLLLLLRDNFELEQNRIFFSHVAKVIFVAQRESVCAAQKVLWFDPRADMIFAKFNS